MSSTPPNFLIFFPDALARHILDDPQIITPHIQKFKNSSLVFNNAHTTNSTCSPARASLMTGLMPHNHGVLQVEHAVDSDQSVLRDVKHWAQNLSEAGYHTGYFGKWHIERSNELAQYGWLQNGVNTEAAEKNIGDGIISEDKAYKNILVGYESGPEGYKDLLHYSVTTKPLHLRRPSKIVDQSIVFIEEKSKAKKPWACMVSFSEPNTPVLCGEESFKKYDLDSIDLPSNFNDSLLNAPGIYRRYQNVYKHMSKQKWQELRACYFAAITELDLLFGKLVNKVKELNQYEKTFIMISSDHGRYLGSHGLDAHNFGGYEEIYNIPFIISGPRISQGVNNSAFIGLHDVGQTLLDLAKAEPLSGIDGKSFKSILETNQTTKEFQAGFAEYHGCRLNITQRIYWEGNYKFVMNGFDQDELYDRANDPLELKNLIYSPEYKDTVVSLTKKIWHQIKRTKDTSLLGTHYSPFRIYSVGPLSAQE